MQGQTLRHDTTNILVRSLAARQAKEEAEKRKGAEERKRPAEAPEAPAPKRAAQAPPAKAPAPLPPPATIRTLPPAQLRSLLQARGLPTSGTPDELAERLIHESARPRAAARRPGA